MAYFIQQNPALAIVGLEVKFADSAAFYQFCRQRVTDLLLTGGELQTWHFMGVPIEGTDKLQMVLQQAKNNHNQSMGRIRAAEAAYLASLGPAPSV